MKKMKHLSLLLAILLLMQCLILPVSAAETTETTEATEQATTDTNNILGQKAEGEFGTVSIQNGCRTINGMMPLGGNDRKLDTAQAAFLYEMNTDTVVYSYNPDMKVAPGNLAKLVTSLIAVETGDLDKVVIVKSRNISRLPAHTQNQNLKEGEEVTLGDLVRMALMVEANDAAIAIAEHIAGNMDAFVAMMNERVKRMGCTSTEFGNVHGLATAASVTTARDMAKITVEAMKNEKFRELFNIPSYEVPATNKSEVRKLVTHNYMIDQRTIPDFYDEKVTGGIPGYAEGIGANLICTKEYKGMHYVGVVMGCLRIMDEKQTWKVRNYGNFPEMTELFRFGFDKYKVNRILYEGMSLKQFPVSGGESNAVGQAYVDYDSVVPIGASMDNLNIKFFLPKNGLKAPIAKEEKIGTLEIWYRNSCMAEAEVFSMGNVKAADKTGVTIRSTAVRSDSDTSGFLSVLGTICVIILGLAMAYLAFNAYMRSRIRAQRRRRREARRRNR